jgi:FAS-associated factor 2
MSSSPDISQLSESQQEALQTYTSVTDQDALAAIPILQKAEWNVQIAITRFFEGEPATDLLAEAQAALPATSSRQASTLQFDDLVASVRPPSTARRNPNSVGRISAQSGAETQYQPALILSLLFTPFTLLYRLFAIIISPIGSLFPFIPRALARLVPTQTPRPSRRSLAPADNARRFIREFSEEYGANDLPFVESGFNLALDNAKKDFKFLLVVLLSPSHDDTSSWVRETLLSSQVRSFFASHRNELFLWGGNIQDAEAYQVADTVQCTKFPFAALVCRTPDSGSTGMSTVMRAAGPISASEMVAKLGTAITAQQGQLSAARIESQQAQASRNLRQEQDSAYERSLAQDRERARLKREETEAQARTEKEALQKEETSRRTAQAMQQWKRWRAQSFPSEPEKNAKDTIRVSIRLANGKRIIRGFRAQADLEEVYAYVECYDLLEADDALSEKEVPEPENFQHSYGFRLVSPMPRTVYTLGKGGSIGERIGKGGNLIVESIGDDEDEEEGVDHVGS